MTVSLIWTDQYGNNTNLVDPAAGIEVEEGAFGFDVPPILNTTAGYVSQDGSALVKRRRGDRTLILPIWLQSTGRVQTLVGQVARILQGPGVLTYSDGTVNRSLLSVIYEGGLEGERRGSVDELGWRQIVAQLVALNPWWHDPEDTAPISTDTEVPFSDPDTDFSDPGVAFNGSSQTTVTVEGDTTALPVWTITGPYDTLVVGIYGGQAFRLANPLADGDVITLSTRPGVRGPRLNGGDIDWSLLTPASRLWELPTGSPVILAGATGTDGGSSVEVAFRQRWLTP